MVTPMKISGVAVKAGVSRNNIKYTSENLMATAHELSDKPLLKDHNASMDNIVGRTLKVDEKGSFFEGDSVRFTANVMDEKMQEMVKDGRAKEVSIGAMVEELVKEEEDDDVAEAKGIHYLELSFTPTPGVEGAGITQTSAEADNHAKTSDEDLETKEKIMEDFKMDEEEKKPEAELEAAKETNEKLKKELASLKESHLNEKREAVKEARKKIGLKGSETEISTLDENALKVLLNDARVLKEQEEAEADKPAEAPAEPETPAEPEKKEEAPAEETPAEAPKEEVPTEPAGEVAAEEKPVEAASERFVMFREGRGTSFGYYPTGIKLSNEVN